MNTKRQLKASDIILLVVLCGIVLTVILFCIFNWQLIVTLFSYIIQGKNVVQEYVLSFGIWGVIALGLMLIFCYFFPFISSLPLQILCLLGYGVWYGTLLVAVSFALGSQFLYIAERNFKTFFYTPKQRAKQADIQARIQNSRRNIHTVMIWLYIVPCIPFLIISSVALRSNMSWWKYTLYTTLGPVPEILATLFLGNQITNASSPIWGMIVLLAMISLVVLSLVFQDKMIYYVFKPKEEEPNTKKNDAPQDAIQK